VSGTISAIVRALVAAKATPEMILAAVEAAEATASDALARRRASDAARQAAKRERTKHDHVMSRDVTVTVSSRDASAPAEPKITNSSEPQKKEESKEGRKEEPPAAGTRSKTLCPIDFQPSEQAIDLARSLGLTLPAVHEARDTMVAWSRGNGERRLDWNAVLANWLRRDATKARAGPMKPRTGSVGWGDIAKFGLDDPRNDQSGSDYELLPAPSHAH